MKKILKTCAAFSFLILTTMTFGQSVPNQTVTFPSVILIGDSFTFSSVKSVRNDKTKEMQFIENVSFRSKSFEFFGADKVIYNETSKKMTVYNCQSFSFNGKVVIKNGENLPNVFEYAIGDDTVYLFQNYEKIRY